MTDFLFVRRNDRHVKIKINDIQFIEADGSYLKIITKSDQFSLALNLSQFERKNLMRSLIRIHRSYIVNFDLIDSFDNNYVYIGEASIPIGLTYRNKFMKSVNVDHETI